MKELVTIMLAGQAFGIPVDEVRDVLAPPPMTPIPLAPPEVAGALNLRGHVVVAIDLRKRLGLPPAAEGARVMCVVVEVDGELYCFLVDRVGDVLRPADDMIEHGTSVLDPAWRQVAAGICRLDDCLLVVLDVGKAIHLEVKAAA
jgi:purine-binding chemotaxis protein CheW